MTNPRSDAVREALAEIMDVLAIADKGWGDGDVCVLQQAVDGAVFDRARAALQSAPAGEAGAEAELAALRSVLTERGWERSPLTPEWFRSHLDHYQKVIDAYSALKSAPSPVTPAGGEVNVVRLIQWLRNAPVTTFDFTIEGRQEVCKPKYLLTKDRDFIIARLSQADKPAA